MKLFHIETHSIDLCTLRLRDISCNFITNVGDTIYNELTFLHDHVSRWFIMRGSVRLFVGLMCDLAAQLDRFIRIESRTDTNAIIIL